jgi:pimeloyl-ACP methyl ester carboxylesterase
MDGEWALSPGLFREMQNVPRNLRFERLLSIAWQDENITPSFTFGGGRFLTVELMKVDGVGVAFQKRDGAAPGLVWLGGYRSDMGGTKAQYLDAYSERTGRALLRHDYSGHGQSEGSVHDGTISQWVRQSLVVFHAQSSGPQILIGSSMGAWIALRMIEELAKSGEIGRVAGLVLIAPAPDFTIDLIEPNLTEAHKRDLSEKGYFEEGSDYLAQPNRFSQAFLDDGRANRVMDGIVETHCPVHILQGMRDADVPFQHALKLSAHFPKDSLTMSLIPDGDHRLSRPQDLTMLEQAIESALAKTQPSL